jgi:hypothetical protein
MKSFTPGITYFPKKGVCEVMDCSRVCHVINTLMDEMKKLEVVYGYLIQNAATEQARRQMELNRMTVRNTLVKLEMLLDEIPEGMMPVGNQIVDIPEFTNFIDAARYAIMEETQVIALLNNLTMMMDECHFRTLSGLIVAHQLNIDRLLLVLS